MPLPIHCKSCGFRSTGVDDLAGKAVKCRDCGAMIRVPALANAGEYTFEVDPPARPTREAPRRPAEPPLRFGPPPPRPSGSPARRVERGSDGGNALPWIIGGVVAFALIAGTALAFLLAPRGVRKGGDGADGDSPAAGRWSPIAIHATLPNFPDVGPGVLLEPGIVLHEIRLPQSGTPGHRGKLWLYLPAGNPPPPGSLPCVMMTGAGSTLLAGMDLGDGDRPEHLPYVREGFAVLAFELDGKANGDGDAEARRAYDDFRAAQAGLVNAKIALEFLLAKVPAVDPKRIYSAGHSSAGTLSLLFAEHEPRLAGSIAFAPAIDLEKRFGAFTLLGLEGNLPGVRDFVIRHSPMNHEKGFTAPVFLFHAEDDGNVPVADSRRCATRLAKLGKSATLEVVPSGDHYNSMIQQGIPKAIAWLKSRTTPPRVPAPTPFVPATGAPSNPSSAPGDVPFSVAPPVTSPAPPPPRFR